MSSNADKRVFIACFPKSASTFLRNVVAEISGYATEEVSVATSNDEQDIYLPALIDVAFTPTSSRMHMRAKQSNVEIMQNCGLKPIVLVRNLFDVTISLRDHCRNVQILCLSDIGPSYNDASEKEQCDMVIDLILPWYFSFFASWQRVRQENSLETLPISYEQMMSDKISTFRNVCNFYNIEASDEKIQQAITAVEGDKKRSNFNVGKVGRGKKELTDEQIERIIKMAGYFKDIDFSSIGI